MGVDDRAWLVTCSSKGVESALDELNTALGYGEFE
jgi:hypothetical protein